MKDFIILNHQKLVEKNYTKFQDHFKDKLHFFVSLEVLRNEILQCLILELNQSSIFATNHFLERMAKLALISKHTLNINYSNLELYNSKTDEAIGLYDSKNLNESLKLANEQSLITNQELETLKDFKNRIRNPYSHAEIKKIINGAPNVFKAFVFYFDEVKESLKLGKQIEMGEKKEITTFSSAISQLYQEKFSSAIAEYYFREVYKILKNIEKKLMQMKNGS